MNLPYVAEAIARLKGISVQEVVWASGKLDAVCMGYRQQNEGNSGTFILTFVFLWDSIDIQGAIPLKYKNR